MRWIDKVMNYYANTESPRRYFYWAGISTVCAVMKRNVWISKKRYLLYPNLFVLIVGRSGLRKNLPIKFARQCAEKVNSRVYYGRHSIEGIITDLAKAKSVPGGDIDKDACAFMVSGEFATFLIQNPAALTILTALYDNDEDWKNVLKHSPKETLTNLGISLLGASSEVHLKETVPMNAVGGGFLGRTLIVHEEERHGIHSLIGDDEDLPLEDPTIISDLIEISKRKGEIKVSGEAATFYNKWYKEFSEMKVKDRTGTYERLHEHVLKVSMALSLISGSDIEKSHIEESIELCLECFSDVQRVFFETGTHPTAPILATVLKILVRRPEFQASRRWLLQHHWRDFDYMELDRVIEQLVQAQMITIHPGGVYKLTGKSVEKFEKFVEKEKTDDI